MRNAGCIDEPRHSPKCVGRSDFGHKKQVLLSKKPKIDI